MIAACLEISTREERGEASLPDPHAYAQTILLGAHVQVERLLNLSASRPSETPLLLEISLHVHINSPPEPDEPPLHLLFLAALLCKASRRGKGEADLMGGMPAPLRSASFLRQSCLHPYMYWPPLLLPSLAKRKCLQRPLLSLRPPPLLSSCPPGLRPA